MIFNKTILKIYSPSGNFAERAKIVFHFVKEIWTKLMILCNQGINF